MVAPLHYRAFELSIQYPPKGKGVRGGQRGHSLPHYLLLSPSASGLPPPLHCITLAFRLNKRIKHGFLISCAKRYHFWPSSGVSFFGEREVIFSRWTLLQVKFLLTVVITVRPSILTSHYLEAKESLSPLFNLIAIAVSHISWFNLGIPNILESCNLEMKPNSQTWS